MCYPTKPLRHHHSLSQLNCGGGKRCAMYVDAKTYLGLVQGTKGSVGRN